MIEATMIWNEPNNRSHRDPEPDPDRSRFAKMSIPAADAVAAANPEWPAKIAELRTVTHLPVRVSEVGVSSFGAEQLQRWGLGRTAERRRSIASSRARARTAVHG